MRDGVKENVTYIVTRHLTDFISHFKINKSVCRKREPNQPSSETGPHTPPLKTSPKIQTPPARLHCVVSVDKLLPKYANLPILHYNVERESGNCANQHTILDSPVPVLFIQIDPGCSRRTFRLVATCIRVLL